MFQGGGMPCLRRGIPSMGFLNVQPVLGKPITDPCIDDGIHRFVGYSVKPHPEKPLEPEFHMNPGNYLIRDCDYAREQVRAGNLLPADEATAKLCKVQFVAPSKVKKGAE